MSKADELFQENCRQILSQGTWDTDLPVRPRWEDGTPAHTIKLFGLVNRYDLREEFPSPDHPPNVPSKARWTSCCGFGRRSPTTSTT